MATLRTQFDRALTNIQINGDKAERAIAVQGEVRDVLEADVQLRAWGVDTKLIGSYGRNTGIYPGKDVDVFVKLTALDTNAPPQAVYDAVWDALAREYGTRAEAQDRSIKVDFSDSGSPGGPSPFSADAVPAVYAGQHWAIPTRDRDLWSGNADRWVVTDPERFGELSSRAERLYVEPFGGRAQRVQANREADASGTAHTPGRSSAWGVARRVRHVRGMGLGPGGWARVGSAVCTNAPEGRSAFRQRTRLPTPRPGARHSR